MQAVPGAGGDAVSANVRPMSEETIGTCDWGGCDDETVAERLDLKSGEWLAVCRKDSGQGADRRQSPGRAVCAECGKEYALLVDRRMRAHNRGFAERCPGSGLRGEP